MKALTGMQHLWDQWSGYLSSCWSMPFTAPTCVPLWSWVSTASMATGALFLFWVAWKMIDYWFKYQAALRAEAHRQAIAPAEEMAKIKWAGDQATHKTIEPDVDMAAKIREELDRRKLQERGMLPPGSRT